MKLASAVLAGLSVVLAEFSCSHTFPDGSVVDLSALSLPPDYLSYRADDVVNQARLSMNVCGVESEQDNCGKSNSMICQFDERGKYINSVARWGSGAEPVWAKIEGNEGVVLTFSNGDNCIDADGQTMESVAIVAFPCSPAVGLGNSFSVVRDPGSCTYKITFPTSASCAPVAAPAAAPAAVPPPGAAVPPPGAVVPPAAGSPAAGSAPAGVVPQPTPTQTTSHWSFITICFFLFISYCLVGCLYKWRKEGATGVEVIPHNNFWCNLPTMIADGCQRIVAIARHTIGSRAGRAPPRTYDNTDTMAYDDPDDNL